MCSAAAAGGAGDALTMSDTLRDGALERAVEEGDGAAGEHAAIHLCVASAQVMVGAARRLMAEPLHLLAPKERAQRLDMLVDELKTGARAAYRAALMLTGQERSDE